MFADFCAIASAILLNSCQSANCRLCNGEAFWRHAHCTTRKQEGVVPTGNVKNYERSNEGFVGCGWLAIQSCRSG